MALEAPDGFVSGDPGTYSQKRNDCGCRGVPDGQHLHGCDHWSGAMLPACAGCGYRAVTFLGVCLVCRWVDSGPDED